MTTALSNMTREEKFLHYRHATLECMFHGREKLGAKPRFMFTDEKGRKFRVKYDNNKIRWEPMIGSHYTKV